ncbi:hypothetical protein BI355_0983 [Companilactobacillus crustorum]|nr:hypothetical protein BI355_0983 [Companilactobacillus crustorum]
MLGGAVGMTLSVLIFYKFGNLDSFMFGFKAVMSGAAILSWLGIMFTRSLSKRTKII